LSKYENGNACLNQNKFKNTNRKIIQTYVNQNNKKIVKPVNISVTAEPTTNKVSQPIKEVKFQPPGKDKKE